MLARTRVRIAAEFVNPPSMVRAKTTFICESCGALSPKWQGQCADCGAWNTLVEGPRGEATRSGAHAAGRTVLSLAQVAAAEEPRTKVGIDELDRVLGGGLVAGAVILLGGDPGIGKSTLLLQACARLAPAESVLYVTGEESPQQVALRARRLGVEGGGLALLAETSVERILATALDAHPRVIVIDSVQTIYTEELDSSPGAVGQLREASARLVRFAKESGTVVFLIGHVTKEGQIAGPRVLEHMVDTVLYFESEAGSRYRIVRAVKNRFGAANEIGVFAMSDEGLREVRNPSAIFLSRHEQAVAGSVVTVTREGSRPLLVEVQALVDESHLSNPRRVAVGLESNRLALLLAILHRHGGVAMYDRDVYVNIVGGMRIAETAADLPLVLAALSSQRDRPIPAETVAFGELGLAGEIRPVPFGEERLREAAKHGFKRALVPAANAPRHAIPGLEVTPLRRLADAVDL
jgi:DNA repair protein RadA/Sms